MRARPELMAKTPSLSFKSNKERKDWKEGSSRLQASKQVFDCVLQFPVFGWLQRQLNHKFLSVLLVNKIMLLTKTQSVGSLFYFGRGKILCYLESSFCPTTS
jgi:hypothetical protein